MTDVVNDALCFELADEAERVRWRADDIPWDRLDRTRVTPALTELVKAIAYSELTTTTATRHFLDEFARDADFTQWISVWFYEETRHPQVLLRWLQAVGVAVDEAFILRGRATAPFMKSAIGTLVTNVISEIVASSAYAAIAERAPEPVLAMIARNLAADEARHAASFYRYARRHLERSAEPHVDRRDALKVVYVWVSDGEHMRHPVNEFFARNRTAIAELGFEPRIPRERVIATIGALIDAPIANEADVRSYLRDAAASSHTEHTR